jgi:hypothetical protein
MVHEDLGPYYRRCLSKINTYRFVGNESQDLTSSMLTATHLNLLYGRNIQQHKFKGREFSSLFDAGPEPSLEPNGRSRDLNCSFPFREISSSS